MGGGGGRERERGFDSDRVRDSTLMCDDILCIRVGGGGGGGRRIKRGERVVLPTSTLFSRRPSTDLRLLFYSFLDLPNKLWEGNTISEPLC